ncbi:MAG: IgGFc-binding protein [bacterium]|jgi:hypothetical protein|nr:IgGFc-binding protein [bacterium]
MKKTFIFIIFAITVFFLSCTKDEESVSENENINDSEATDKDPSADGDSAGSDTENSDDNSSKTDDDSKETPDNENPSITCTPGMRVCNPSDNDAVYECNAEGTGLNETPVETCEEGLVCFFGKCESAACASSGSSYEGCEFYTAKLYNGRKTELVTEHDSFSVAIANTHPTLTATIKLLKTLPDGTETPVSEFAYCYKTVENDIFGNPYDAMKCDNKDSGFAITIPPKEIILVTPRKDDRMLIGTSASFLSYHIQSDVPVTIYQFNPFENLSSNDASLLFPSKKLGTDYYVSTYEDQTGVGSDGPGYFTVIGVNNMDVELEIVPTVEIKGGGGIPASPAGTPFNVTVRKGEVLNITSGNNLDDLTGTRIYCKNPLNNCVPFAVFGGHGCANIPKDRGYCDHLEHQLLPVNRWGQRYAVVKTRPREKERDVIRIVASEDSTNVKIKTMDDKQESGNEFNVTLNKGQWHQYEIYYFWGDGFDPGSSFIEADKPVQVVQYLSGSEDQSFDCRDSTTGSSHTGCYGDPAMSIIPPVEQFRNEYFFFSSSVKGEDDGNENFVQVVTDQGVFVTLDETTPVPVKQGTVYGSDKIFYIFELDEDFMRHQLNCTGPCGILIYGWGMDVSYMYPGGLNLRVLK